MRAARPTTSPRIIAQVAKVSELIMGGKAPWSQSQVKRKAASDVGLAAFHAESSEERQVKAIETTQHTSFRAFISRHAVLTYVTLVFALTLGPWGLALITASPGAFPGTGDELTPLADPDPVMVLAWLLGTLSPALAGILVIALAYGGVGLRDLRSQLFRWRVGVRWYAVALLTVPLLMTAILAALSLTSKAFLTTTITAEDTAKLLAGYLVVGLVISFFEEIGWTGFATHELRKRHGLLATGLILGLPWGVMPAVVRGNRQWGCPAGARGGRDLLLLRALPDALHGVGLRPCRACCWRCSCTCRSSSSCLTSSARRWQGYLS